MDKFQATSFGRLVRDAGPVDPPEVNGLGFLLGDKKAGPFTLEVEWIRAVRAEAAK
ncbi:MAG: CIA30 family protein [Planctomycetia bacterium]|nr:CIA30 family protein [Planctomycetia bacterium]